MNDQSKSQAQKSQPTDLISSIKNKTELKESEKNNTLDNEWNDYSDNEEEDTPVQSQTQVKEKENKDKNDPKKLGDILSKKQPIQQQQQRRPYNNNNKGDRKPREGGMKKYYNANVDQNKNFSNQNPNYVRKDKYADKEDLEKKIGNFKNIIADNNKSNEGMKSTKTYDIEPTPQNKESQISKPVFVNQEMTGNNLRELNLNEDLYMKNVRERGLDKEVETNQGGEEEGENKKRRVYNNKEKRPYNNNKNFQNRQRNYNNNGPKPEKELDEDGFEKVVNKPKRTTPYNYNRNRDNRPRNDNEEQRVWESVTEQVPREERENQEESEVPEGERQKREEKPRDQRDRRDKKGQRKENTVWETEPQIKEKPKENEVVKPQQQTKVEITVKTGALKDIFNRKK